MSIFSNLFNSGTANKAVDAIIDSGDALVYTEEEKSITLKILNTAAEISKSTL